MKQARRNLPAPGPLGSIDQVAAEIRRLYQLVNELDEVSGTAKGTSTQTQDGASLRIAAEKVREEALQRVSALTALLPGLEGNTACDALAQATVLLAAILDAFATVYAGEEDLDRREQHLRRIAEPLLRTLERIAGKRSIEVLPNLAIESSSLTFEQAVEQVQAAAKAA